MDLKKAVSEFVGTLLLVFFGVGALVFDSDRIGALGVALAFGLILLVLAYTLGPVSGAHVNPAVTLGMFVNGRISLVNMVAYWVAQLLGGIVGAALVWGFVRWGDAKDTTGTLGATDYAGNINLGGALVTEVILTFLLVFVVLVVTGRAENAGFAGLAIGLSLAVIHLVGIPLTGGSVNPARSLGPALFERGDALVHVWVYFVAPLVGGVLAALAYPFVAGEGRRYRARPAASQPVTD